MTIIRIVDFETNGIEPPAQVCEVGICDFHLERKVVDPFISWLCGVDVMPPEVRAIHHISLAEVEGERPFVSDMLAATDIDCFAAHNADFEAKFWAPHLPMICTYKSALRIWPDRAHSQGVIQCGGDR